MIDTTYLLLADGDATRQVPVMFSVFPDGDTHCVIEDAAAVKDHRVLIVHQLYPQQNEQIIKLLLLLDLLHDIGASAISVFSPYLPYARQDKRHIAGESISIDTLCRVLAATHCARLYTLDCHFMRGVAQETRARLAITNFSLGQLLLDECQRRIGHTHFEVVGPDEGAAYLTTTHGAKNMRKERATYDGLATGDSYRKIATLTSDHLTLHESTVVIVDDMISTGSTLLRAITNLQAQSIKHVYCIATHGLFIGDSYRRLQACTDDIICSDSIPQPFSLPLVETVLRTQVVPAWLTD